MKISLAAVLALACTTALAQDAAGWEFSGSLGLQYRRLEERTTGGNTLLVERGPMPTVVLHAGRPLGGSGGAVAGRLLLATGNLHYDGQTQAGAPLSTRSRQSEIGADLLWRPMAASRWGEGWLTLGWLGNRRAIRGTPVAGGLDEDSSALMAGVLWRTPVVAQVSDWQVRVELEGRLSVRHRLYVDYQGLLDPSRFDGARKRQTSVRLLASAPGSPWEWGVEWSGLAQSASGSVPVYRGGALFGTVRQPELSVMDLGLRVSRRF